MSKNDELHTTHGKNGVPELPIVHDLSGMDARQLYAAFERGVHGAKEAYEKHCAKCDVIKRDRKRRSR